MKGNNTMRYCHSCGYEISDDEEFCPECGTKLGVKEKTCECGEKLTNKDKFCPKCGKETVVEEVDTGRR